MVNNLSEKILTLEGTREEFILAKKAMDDIQSDKEALEKAKKEYLAKAEQEFLDANQAKYVEIEATISAFNKANTNYRQEVLAEYTNTLETRKDEKGEVINKKVDDFSSIRVDKEIKYDLSDALGWATEHKLALTVDTKVFDTFVRASKDVKKDYPFVTITDIPRVVIKGTK